MRADKRATLRSKWRSGEAVVGAWCSIGASFAVELVGTANPDYVCLDAQHGLYDLGGLVPSLQVADSMEAAVLVRVPSADPWMIGRVLDLGADGVIVPMVETREMAAGVVAAARYRPEGVRSYGPTRAAVSAGRTSPTWHGDAISVVMVETDMGLEAVDQIATVDGLDGVYVGPADLSLSLGVSLDAPRPNTVVEAAFQTVLDASVAAGVVPGIHCTNGDDARIRRLQGFRMVTVTSDVAALRSGLADDFSRARSDT